MSESTESVIRWSQGYITQKDFKKLTKKLSEKELMELMAKVSEIFIQVPSRKWRGSWMWKLVVNHFKVVACQICFSQINWTKVRKILNILKFFFQLDANKDGQLSFEEFKVLFDNAEKRRKDSEAGRVRDIIPDFNKLFQVNLPWRKLAVPRVCQQQRTQNQTQHWRIWGSQSQGWHWVGEVRRVAGNWILMWEAPRLRGESRQASEQSQGVHLHPDHWNTNEFAEKRIFCNPLFLTLYTNGLNS